MLSEGGEQEGSKRVAASFFRGAVFVDDGVYDGGVFRHVVGISELGAGVI